MNPQTCSLEARQNCYHSADKHKTIYVHNFHGCLMLLHEKSGNIKCASVVFRWKVSVRI